MAAYLLLTDGMAWRTAQYKKMEKTVRCYETDGATASWVLGHWLLIGVQNDLRRFLIHGQ